MDPRLQTKHINLPLIGAIAGFVPATFIFSQNPQDFINLIPLFSGSAAFAGVAMLKTNLSSVGRVASLIIFLLSCAGFIYSGVL